MLLDHLAFGVELSHTHFFLLDKPDVIGPAGTNNVGKCTNCRAPITSPGTILSQIPNISTASNIWWERRDGGRLRNDVPAEQAQLHPGLSLGDAIAHGGYRPRHLCCAPDGFQG